VSGQLRGWTLVVASVTLLAACSASQIGAPPKAWCDANLGLVSAAGTKVGSAFHFSGGADVSWNQFLGSSAVEQGIIVSEATGGTTTWDIDCRQAYVDAHPAESPLPTIAPSGG
jgi:hypothetical protein